MHGHQIKIMAVLISVLFCGSLPAASGQTSRRPDNAVLADARRNLRDLEGRARLARNVGEFVAEIDLFDNHLYGRLRERGDRVQAERLRDMLRIRNGELARMMNNPPRGLNGEGSEFVSSDTRTYLEAVYNLQSEITGMLSELREVENAPAQPSAAELLDGSMWRGREVSALLTEPFGADLPKLLERARIRVDSLENVDKLRSASRKSVKSGEVTPE